MIQNDQELQITKEWLVKFRDTLADIELVKDGDPILKELQVGAFKSQIEIFEDDIKVYHEQKGISYQERSSTSN